MGMMHIYTGEGKGKTTAALGLAVRAAGSGRRVLIAQFFKGRDSSELNSLALLPNVKTLRLSRDHGFHCRMDEAQKLAVRAEHDAMLRHACEAANSCGLIVLDEAISAYNLGALDRELLLELVRLPGRPELVLTGRDAPQELTAAADYITEMVKVRHPFDSGVAAREGIEY